jgi:hypothetical protein
MERSTQMPGFDRTGPAGAGPRTGWGRGLCGTTAGAPRFSWSGLLRGIGRGGLPWGGGKGRCFGRGTSWWSGRFASPMPFLPAKNEAEVLKNELAAAEAEIAAMKSRLEELEKRDRS